MYSTTEKKRKRLSEEEIPSPEQKDFKQTKLTVPSSSLVKVPLLKQDHDIPGLYIAENFITKEQEIEMMKEIDKREWNSELTRRTQHYGYAYNYSSRNVNNSNGQSAPPIPEVFLHTLKNIKELASDLIGSVEFKQVIVNEYKGTNQGISKHVDQCLDFGPFIIIVSLGDDCVMKFHKLERVSEEELVKKSVKRKEVSPSVIVDKLLSRRSLVILSKDARYQYQHEIPKTKTFKVKNKVVKTRTHGYRRVSVTFRSILSDLK
ncbi:hypothetical protein C9374_000184 [Naegleria lovaniensis]|uniref:Alpha-ketoglutarate-dependent dioxygenase AlkB-like domain-containing protein n=1 Tax=Naegleria lovaniensis TaxID=51637 RepID=A0AA88GTS7_NAELO|nr:uncharacterized protein C9374_000184 [Naegleria lovaniensis]KAG2388745.1 hypothetical protein C9374_000184 [Naegleria lovaniensis]